MQEEKQKQPKRGGRAAEEEAEISSGNELFSLLPSALGATDQTQPHSFIFYSEDSQCNQLQQCVAPQK